jgi:hypothetical protein
MSRPISDAWFYRIKSATRDLVKMCGGIERAGEIAMLSKTVMGRCQSAGDPDIISICAALALEAECGVAMVTTAMADLQGRRVIEASEDPAHAGRIFARNAEVMRAASELMAVGATAASDGKVTPAEAEQMDRAAAALDQTIEPLRQDLARARAGTLKVVR